MSAKHRNIFLGIDVDEFDCSVIEPDEKAAIEWAQELIHRLHSWSQAYPLDLFPEPDLKAAHEVLSAHGMGIGGISASMGRHVLRRVAEMLGTDVNTGSDTGQEPPQ